MHTLIHTRASNAKKPTPHTLVLIPQRTAVAFLHHLLNYTEKQVNILFSMIIQHLLQLFKIYGHGCAAATNAGKLMAFEPPLYARVVGQEGWINTSQRIPSAATCTLDNQCLSCP